MKKFMKKTIAAGAIAVIAGLGFVSSHDEAKAGNGDFLAAGIAGGFLGAIIAPRYVAPPVYYPAPVYVYPEPVYVEPAPVYVAPPVYYPQPVYRHPRPVYGEPVLDYGRRAYDPQRPYGKPSAPGGPKVVTYDETVGKTAGVEPGSPAWLDYCRSKFRSFRVSDGTYLGYDGQRHLCVVR